MQTRYLRALIAVLFVSGVAGATFFVSNRLSTSQNVAPNAPESEPQAFSTTIRNGIRLPDEDIRDIQRTTTPKSSAPVVGRSDERDYDPAELRQTTPTPIVPTKTPTPYSGANIPTRPTPKIDGETTPNNPVNTPTVTIAENRYGYRPPDTTNVPEYMKPDKNKCKDGLGFVSGTLCVENPNTGEVERKVVNLPSTIKASKDALETARSKIENKSDEELLQIAAQSGKSCPPNDYACQKDLIATTTQKILVDNAVVITKDIDEIRNAREKNQVTYDAINLSTKDFKKKYDSVDISTTLQQKGITNPTDLANANFLITAYKESKTPAMDIIEYICKGNLACKKELKTENINNLLKQAVGDKIPTSSVEEIIKNKNFQSKAQTYTDLFLNQSMSDKDKVDKYCKDEGIDPVICRKNVEVNDLAAYAADPKALIQLKTDYSTQRIILDPNYDQNDLAKIYCGGKTAGCTPEKILGQIKNEEVKQSTNDQLLAKIFSDVKNSTTDLAKIYCEGLTNPGPKCRDEYNQNAFLSLIKNPEVKQQAINNRNQQLFQYIIPVTTNQTASGIDVETKKEVEKFDTDFQHAYWAYYKEKIKGVSCPTKNGVTTCTGGITPADLNDKLGEDFYKLFASNPSEFNKYLSQYNANPKLFTDIQTATAFKPTTDINSSIIALSNQAVKKTEIKGLFDGNKVVSWNQASEEYKQDARKIACANDKSIAIYCSAIDGYASKRITEEQRDNALAQIDATIARNNKQTAYLQEVYQSKITNNLPSSFYSNTVAIDNFTVPQEVRDKAIQQAKNEITKNIAMQGQGTTNPRAIASQQYQIQNLNNTDFLNGNLPITNLNINTKDLVTEKLDQMTVTETYTRGGGMAASLTAAGLATTACAALGPPGIAISLGCGAVAGLAGVVATYVPIWGTVTAEEMAAEQQSIKEFRPSDILENDLVNFAMSITPIGILEKNLLEKYGKTQIFNNDGVASTVQSLYKSQGAYCDTADGGSIGGSCTRKDNPYANYQSMLNTYGQYGANLNALSDTSFVNQLAIQGTINQQFDALQIESQNQAIANIVVAPIIGAASGGIGGRLAQSSAAINNPSYTQALLRQQLNDWILWAPGSAVGTLQNYAQFDATTGFTDTQAEIDLEICVREKGRDMCNDKQKIVDDETKDAMKTTLFQGFLTDAALQVGQSGFSFATQYAQIASQNPNTPPPDGSNISNQTRPTDPNDSSFISPQLARELNNIDPRILANTDPAIITAVIDSLGSSSRNGVTDSTATELNLWQDVGLISEDYIINQLANSRTAGPLSPQEQNIINSIRESNLRKPEGVESLAADIARRSTLSETELVQSLVDRGYTDKEINIARAIKTNSDPLAEFIKDPTMSNFLLLDEHIQNESIRLGITTSQYLDIAGRYQEMYTQTNIPEDVAGLIAYIKEQPQTATTPQVSTTTTTTTTTTSSNQRITLEEITSIPTEFLNGLTQNERTQLDNLVTAINNSTNDNQRATFQKVLKQQIDSFLAGDSNTQLLTTPANPNVPATYESLVGAPRELFTDQQLSDIDNLIVSVQNAKSESERIAFTEVLRQTTNNYLNDGFQASNNFIVPTTDFTEGNQSYLLTLAKDLNVDTTSKSETQIRSALKQEMNKRVFGNENGPTAPTGNTEIRGYVFRDSEGNVLTKDFYWRPEEFADPFVFTKKEAEAVFANSKNWRFKPNKTYEAKYNSFLEKTFIGNEGPTTINGFIIKNSKGQSLDEFGQWRRSFFVFDSGHTFTLDEIKNLNLKIRALSDDPLTIQNVEYQARPRSVNFKDEYTYTDLMKQEALKEAIVQYNSNDTAITDYLKKTGYTNEEIKYAVDNRKLPEAQEIISLLREFNNKANSEFTNALENTPRNSSFIDAINAIEDRLLSQRQELLNSRFSKAQNTNLIPIANNTLPTSVPPTNLNTTNNPDSNIDIISQVLPTLNRNQIQEQLNSARGQRALKRINDNDQTATEITPGRIAYAKRGTGPDRLAIITRPLADSLDTQIYMYAKSIGVEPSGKSMPEIIALIKQKNNSIAQAPKDTQPDVAPLPTTTPNNPMPTSEPKSDGKTQPNIFKQAVTDILKGAEKTGGRTGGRKGISEAGHVLLLDRKEVNYTTTPDGTKIKVTKNKIGGLFTITEDHEWISINQRGEVIKHIQTKIAGISIGKEIETNTHTLSNHSEDIPNYYYELQTIEEKYNDITKINREKGDQSYNRYNDPKYNLEIHNLQNKYANETGLVFINEDYLIAQYKKDVSKIQKILQETNSSNKGYSLLDDALYQDEIIKLQDSYKRQGLVFKDSENNLDRYTNNLYPEAADPADRAGLFTNILNLTPSDQTNYKYIAQEMHAMNSGTFKPQKSPEAFDYADTLIYATARYRQDKDKIKTDMKNLGYKERDIDQAIRTIKNPKYLSSEIINTVETIENKLYDRIGQFGTTFKTKERITESTITNSITEYAKKQTSNPVTPLKTNYDGKLIVTDERFPGVTFISGANGQNEISTKDIRSLPTSLNEQLKSKYTQKEIEELSGQIANEKLRINQDQSYSKPITDIIDVAKKHNIPINNRTLREISIDVRTAENQIDRKIGQLAPLSESERRYSVKSIPPILAEKILEIHDFDPNATIHKVEFNNFRYWSLDYFDSNPNWVEFTQNIRSNESIPSSQREKIIQAAREHLTDHINMSLRSNNPDIITYPKGNTKYTLDLHPSRENSLALMKKFLSGNLISDTKAALIELNSVITNGGSIKNVQIDPEWNVKNLDLKEFKAGDIVTLTVSYDPSLPVIASFVDNGIYFDFQGENNEVYTGVFGYQLKESIPNLSPDFPVIEQTSINDPDQKTITVAGKGGIKITGKKMDPDFISDTPQITTYRQAVTLDEINNLANHHHDSSTTAEALYASLTADEKQAINDGKVVDVYITNSTEATINKVTHISGDLAGSSPMTTAVLRVASQMTDRSMALKLLNGSADIQDVYLQKLSKNLTVKAGFKKFETAGDGLRGFKTDVLTAETISDLTDISSIYQDVFSECQLGLHGENAKFTADTVIAELGDNSVDFKLAISTGDVKFTFLPGKDSFGLEIKPSGNTDIYLENVKKYINILKERKETPPKNIIGISEDIYETLLSTNQIEKLSSFGKKIITENIPGYGDAYFVVKDELTTSSNNKLLISAQPMHGLLLPDIILDIFKPRRTLNIPNNNSPITIKNIELIISPEKNQLFIDSIDITDQFNSGYNRATIYYDKNGQIVGFGDISKLHPKTQESILKGQYFKTTMLIPKDDTKKYMITEVQETKNIVAHKIITETIELLNNRDTAIALLAQTGKIDIVENTRIQLRKYVSKLLGVVVGVLIEGNFGEEISQGINSFFNMSMSSGTLAPGTQNQQDLPISPSPVAKITPTTTPIPEPTPYSVATLNLNNGSDSDFTSRTPTNSVTTIVEIVNKCEQSITQTIDNRGIEISECFCNSFEITCEKSKQLNRISQAIRDLYKQDQAQNTTMALYFLLSSGVTETSVIQPAYNQNKNIIISSVDETKLFSQCSDTDLLSDLSVNLNSSYPANKPIPGDIIEVGNKQYVCLIPETINNLTTCKTLTIGQDKNLSITDIKILPSFIIYRSAKYKNSSCWTD